MLVFHRIFILETSYVANMKVPASSSGYRWIPRVVPQPKRPVTPVSWWRFVGEHFFRNKSSKQTQPKKDGRPREIDVWKGYKHILKIFEHDVFNHMKHVSYFESWDTCIIRLMEEILYQLILREPITF